jgi:DNA-binding IclR family transcriptional regulator
VNRPPKERPPYSISSVDHALRLAAILQLEGGLTVTEAAERLNVARSTAHRLLAMLVYRDFAVQNEQREYHAGPVLEIAVHSKSEISRLRAVALAHMAIMVDDIDESLNLIIRTGDTARFIASVECTQQLRVGNREGMAFPAHLVTGGLVLLAQLSNDQVESLYSQERYTDRLDQRPDLGLLQRELLKIRKRGFAVTQGLAETGIVAIGVPVRNMAGEAIAGLSMSLPSVRFDPTGVPEWVAKLASAAAAIETDINVGLEVGA